MKTLLTAWAMFLCCAHAQVAPLLYVERFDSSAAPSLPPGWSTTTNRSASGDFVTTTSSPRSLPNALISTNATISQSLTSPSINCSGTTPTRLEFFVSRSGSHTANLLVEASLDGGATFPIALGDTIRNPGTTGYVLTSLPLPSILANQEHVRFRWRLIAVQSGGTSGTFRMDDISVYVQLASDIALSALQLISDYNNRTVGLAAIVRNMGSQIAAGYSVRFFRDINSNRIAEASEEFERKLGGDLSPQDSSIISVPAPPLNAGENRFIAVILMPSDKNSANDTAFVSVTVGAEPQSVIINEIMFDPLLSQNEWIELYHRGADPIDIARWKFFDRPTASGSNSFLISSGSVILQPHDFIVVAAESSIVSQFPYLATAPSCVHLVVLNRTSGFGFNNDGDDLVLRDLLGTTIDSLSYSSSWHHPDVSDAKGRSLERISPEITTNDKRNWSSSPSPSGGTPGKPNGIFTTGIPSSASLSVSPNPFSPDGDGFEDFCIVRYNLPLATSVIRISIFDIRGRLLRTLADTELSGSTGEVVWDGLDDVKRRVRIGPYIVFIEAIDGQAGVLATAKTVVVVATKF